jgi:hypothetical protein
LPGVTSLPSQSGTFDFIASVVVFCCYVHLRLRLQEILAKVSRRDPEQREFLQAVEEVLMCLEPGEQAAAAAAAAGGGVSLHLLHISDNALAGSVTSMHVCHLWRWSEPCCTHAAVQQC